MWTKEHRRIHARNGLRYPSDLTDEEWALVAPVIPPAKRGGRPRRIDIREVLNTVFYVLSTGCQWNALPTDLPAKSTVYDYFSLWRSDRTLLRLHQALYAEVREAEGRKPVPTVGIIDSQSAKAAQKGGPRSIRRATTRACRTRRAMTQRGSSSARRSSSTSSRARPEERRVGKECPQLCRSRWSPYH